MGTSTGGCPSPQPGAGQWLRAGQGSNQHPGTVPAQRGHLLPHAPTPLWGSALLSALVFVSLPEEKLGAHAIESWEGWMWAPSRLRQTQTALW